MRLIFYSFYFYFFLYLYYGSNNFCYKINIIQLCELLGDYDLKVMRQEYYIGRQKAVYLAFILYFYMFIQFFFFHKCW